VWALLTKVITQGTEKIQSAVETTFARRNTHPIPTRLEPPPAEWQRPFATPAEECRLKVDLTQAGENVAEFWDSNSTVSRNNSGSKKKSVPRVKRRSGSRLEKARYLKRFDSIGACRLQEEQAAHPLLSATFCGMRIVGRRRPKLEIPA
jgi:hypothetical protein